MCGYRDFGTHERGSRLLADYFSAAVLQRNLACMGEPSVPQLLSGRGYRRDDLSAIGGLRLQPLPAIADRLGRHRAHRHTHRRFVSVLVSAVSSKPASVIPKAQSLTERAIAAASRQREPGDVLKRLNGNCLGGSTEKSQGSKGPLVFCFGSVRFVLCLGADLPGLLLLVLDSRSE